MGLNNTVSRLPVPAVGNQHMSAIYVHKVGMGEFFCDLIVDLEWLVFLFCGKTGAAWGSRS